LAIATPLSLLRRSLSASADLDRRIAELAVANELPFLSAAERKPTDLLRTPATLIANLSGARTVAIYLRDPDDSSYALLTSHGVKSPARMTEDEIQAVAAVSRSSGDWSIKDATVPTINEGGWLPGKTDFNLGNSDHTLLLLNGDKQPSGVLLVKGAPQSHTG